MRIVVTGGAGFVGSHLCARLVAEGHDVLCLDNLVTGSADNVADLADAAHGSFRLDVVDVSDSAAVQETVRRHGSERVDVVLDLASPASPIDYLEIPIETLKAGSYGTFSALDVAREHGARFVLASTSETYGDPQVHPQPESYWGNVNPVGPRAVYDEAKRFAEAATMAYRRTYGVNTGIVRIFNTFGPRMRAHDGRAIPTFVRQALAGEPVTVAGDGSQTRSLCYVDDLVDGLCRMATSEHAGPVNLGNPEEISMLDLARWIVELTGSSSDVAFIERPVDDPAVRRPDITLAGELLGWSPAVPVEQGLRQTIDWFRESGALDTEREALATVS